MTLCAPGARARALSRSLARSLAHALALSSGVTSGADKARNGEVGAASSSNGALPMNGRLDPPTVE